MIAELRGDECLSESMGNFTSEAEDGWTNSGTSTPKEGRSTPDCTPENPSTRTMAPSKPVKTESQKRTMNGDKPEYKKRKIQRAEGGQEPPPAVGRSFTSRRDYRNRGAPKKSLKTPEFREFNNHTCVPWRGSFINSPYSLPNNFLNIHGLASDQLPAQGWLVTCIQGGREECHLSHRRRKRSCMSLSTKYTNR